jgi:choline monooxygenase
MSVTAAPETWTLPAETYTSADIFQRERAAIFGREWLLIGHEGEMPNPGDYVATEIAGWPVFVIRSRDGGLKGFHNVCRHRAGNLVNDGAGHCEQLRCRYHGWLYDHDGRLRRRPDFADIDDAKAAELALFPVRAERWRGFVFINLDANAGPLEAGLGGLPALTTGLAIESYKFHGRRSYDLDFNWKTYTDNYLEAYHIPYLHPSLAADLEMSQYHVENGDRVCVHRVAARGGAAYQGLFMWRWPNNTLGFYGQGFNICRILPKSESRLQLIFDFFFDPAADLSNAEKDAAAKATCDVVEEDFPICAVVQRNYAAGVYQAGPLSPKHETGLVYFHDLVRRAALGKR